MTRGALLVVLWLAAGTAAGQPRCADHAPLKNAYFGDLHTHTSYSFDAVDYGTRTDPASAYAFALGAAVDVANGADPAAGQTPGPNGVTIASSGGPLDFLAVTDHAEFLGTVQGCTVDEQSGFHDNPYCVALRGTPNPRFLDPTAPNYVVSSPCLGTQPNGTTAANCQRATTGAWQAIQQAATAANAPCSFTTFNAFEWSGVDLTRPGFATLHRNVFFANEHVPALPIDYVTYRGVKLLWAALDAQCRAADGCEAITIPHNSNQSRGGMFDLSGLDATDLERMARYQRLVEIHQNKGGSECLTDTADDGAVSACTFEIETGDDGPESVPGYVRPALERGLVQHAQNRLDPLQLGIVGATDTHDATPGNVGETQWPGHLGILDNTLERRLTDIAGQNPGGITGVWAEENTRESLWAALMRREVFATSGPRIRVRFYADAGGGDPCADPDFPAQLVAAGAVPMGGTIVDPVAAPRLVAYALADATPLAAVDIVKASVAGGDAVERVTTIPLAAPPYCITWTDPAFDPTSPAVYYARVRQQPTWRWSHYDCERLRAAQPADWAAIAPGCASNDPTAGGLDVTVEERAWTSPIWYLPGRLVTVATTVLRLRDGASPANPKARRFRWDGVSAGADHTIAAPAAGQPGDPTRGGATLVVYNAAGSGEAVTIELPAAGWRVNRTRTRYVFRGRPVGSPVQRVVLAGDRIAVRAGTLAFGYSLDEPTQGRVAVRLRVAGGTLWCAEALPATDVPGKFVAASPSAAPARCPLVP